MLRLTLATSYDEHLIQVQALKRFLVERFHYRIEVSADGREEHLIRPDGTLALSARRNGGCL